MSENDRTEFREFLQFCIQELRSGKGEEEIFAAWKERDASVPKAG